MRNFKFLKGFIPVEGSVFNEATDPYLIQLSQEIWDYSSWIEDVILLNSSNENQDMLNIIFKDIDGNKYLSIIYQDLSFELIKIIINDDDYDDDYDDETIHPISIPEELSVNHYNLIDYLKNMPKTILGTFDY